MDSHRYPLRAMSADYGRAAAGLALTLGPIAVFGVAPPVVYVLGGFSTLFAVFGVRTMLRHLTRIEVSADEIRVVAPVRAILYWRDLDSMTLSYYSTRRDRQGGWMQLKLRGARCALKLDSTIEGFPAIAQQALCAARDNRVALSRPTLANLAALGLAIDDQPPARV